MSMKKPKPRIAEDSGPMMKPPKWIGKDGRRVYRRITKALLPLGGLDPRMHTAICEIFSVTAAQTISAARQLVHNEESAAAVRRVLRRLVQQVKPGAEGSPNESRH
jgi:phage terminase small subunit